MFCTYLLHCNLFYAFFYCRATTEECPLAIIVMSTQSIIGVIIQACMAGIIFAKFTVPRKRGQTLVFSKNAVITMRNGSLYLISRVCDLRKSALLEAHVRMVIIKKEVTDEGELKINLLKFRFIESLCHTAILKNLNFCANSARSKTLGWFRFVPVLSNS